jgi:periplasmic copper chaperone A
MKSLVLHAVMAIAAAISAAQCAGAHAVLQVREARVGAPYRATLTIPHGCEGSATVKVRIEVPEGVIGVKPMPKPGWTITTVRGPYAQSYKYYHQQTLTEGVKEIIWTGRLADDSFEDFVFAGFLADSLHPGSPIYFPTYQECEKGSHRWIEIPAPGQSAHDLSHPAPALMLLPAANRGATASYRLGPLLVEAPWARATPGGAPVAAGYLRITNTGASPDRLIGGSLPIAGAVEVHDVAMVDGVMKMRRLESGLEIRPGQTVELKPGGFHLMFTGLRGGLKEGEQVGGTLIFEKGGTLAIEYRVAPIGAQSGSAHSHH